MNTNMTRRTAIAGAAAGVGVLAAGTRPALSQAARPKSPLAITVVDVAGNLALTQAAFEAYRKAKPEMIGKISFTKAPAPELPSKIRAQQNANKVDIDIVLTGTDALAAGIEQKIWLDILPQHAAALPKLDEVLLPGALKMQALAQNQGVIVSFSPGGPLLEYMPDKVKVPPTSADELLAWTRQNKNRFMYARPANSGPGRAFMMGLPYLLGDSNPKDPIKGWDKTWAYLSELDKNIEYYPTGTGATMKELGEGSRDIIATMTGWDINPRALGIVPAEAKVTLLKGFHFIMDGHYVCIPKGLDAERTAVLLDLVSFLLTKPAQAFNWDEGYFYPGPAVKDVPLSMAPQKSQDVMKEFGRPEYAALIASTPNETPLDAAQMVMAFRKWDETIGAGGKKTK
jgi:putative spermidine/putrescine transport system substrate-binding protein